MITDKAASSYKPRDRDYMVRDDKGLYLRVTKSGKKYWIIRHWTDGKEKQKSLGAYPLVSLKEAREKRDAFARAKASGDIAQTLPVMTFGATAAEWTKVKLSGKSASYIKATSIRLHKHILPVLDTRKIADITSAECLRLLRRIEATGHIDTVSRVKCVLSQIFRFAIASGYLETDPTVALRGAIMTRKQKHYSAPKTLAELLLIVDIIKKYPYALVRDCLLFQLLTATRPSEARCAKWAEISGDVWTIPEERMKKGEKHIVPLSPQALKVLDDVRTISGQSKFIFPSLRDVCRPLSDAAARVALRTMGLPKETITPHGFRSAFSTIMNERGENADVIEACLSHADKNSVRSAYNRANYIEQRRLLLKGWAELLQI